LYTTLLTDATLFDALLAIDQELAATAQAGGCRHCAGRLDHADYPRKPRGGPATLSAAYEKRASFCCDAEGCRTRLTPGSVRFLGRRVYLGRQRHRWRLSGLRTCSKDLETARS